MMNEDMLCFAVPGENEMSFSIFLYILLRLAQYLQNVSASV